LIEFIGKNKYFILVSLLLVAIIIVVLRWSDKGLLVVQEEPHDEILRIHSPLNERIIKPIIKEFQESTGIQVKYLSGGTMEVLKTMDNKQDKYLMDVMWGGSSEYLDLYKNLFEPYTSIYEDKIQQENNEADNYYLGYYILPIVLIYNTKIVSPEEVPKSWEDVLDPKWKGKLAFADPNNSGSAFMALSFLLNLNQSDTLIKSDNTGFKNNWNNAEMLIRNIDGKNLAKSSEVYEGVAKGDFAIGISMEEAAIAYLNKGEDLGIVYLKEGTPILTDSIALMKDAKNKDNAKLFIDFVLSKKVQKYMVDHFYLRSIRNDVDIPMGLNPLEQINIFDASTLGTYINKIEVLKIWDELKLSTEQAGK